MQRLYIKGSLQTVVIYVSFTVFHLFRVATIDDEFISVHLSSINCDVYHRLFQPTYVSFISPFLQYLSVGLFNACMNAWLWTSMQIKKEKQEERENIEQRCREGTGRDGN